MQGTTVGNYRIESKIGEGGMGVVYSAQHTRMAGRAVVKVLHQQFAHNRTIAKRFENEANAAASIGHPGIVKIFDIGQADDGSLYIVMELLEGESLQDRLRRLGRLPVQQAMSIIRQAAGALGAAHKAGIVHRDLKPDNLFLVPDPEVPGGERVKILDFGIAKLADADASGMQTGTGTMMGTPHFMSPEQCRGAGEVDYRTDLYALGCILFLLISGRTPFVGEGAGDFIAQHLTQPPPALRTLTPEAPDYLEDLITVLLAKDPQERFQSTDALIAALDGFIDPTSIPGASASYPGSHPGDANSVSPIGLANTAVPGTPPPTTLGASAGQALHHEAAPRPRGRSPLLFVAPVLVAAAAGAFFVLKTDDKKTQQAATTTIATAPAPTLKSPTLALNAITSYKTPQGSAINEFSSSSWWQAVAIDFEEAASQKGAPPLWRAGRSFALGFITLLDSDFEGAVGLFREAATLDPSWALPHAALSIGLTRLRKFDAALAAAQEAQRIDPEWPGAIAAAARVLVNADRLDDAIQEYRRALGKDKENPNLLAELSLVYHSTRLDSEATRYAKMALDIDPDLVAPRILLAERALEDDDGETALAQASRAVAASPRSLAAHLAYADALAMLKKTSNAKAAYKKVLALRDALGDAQSEHDERIERIRKTLAKGRVPGSTKARKRSKTRRRRSERSSTGANRSSKRDDPLSGLNF